MKLPQAHNSNDKPEFNNTWQQKKTSLVASIQPQDINRIVNNTGKTLQFLDGSDNNFLGTPLANGRNVMNLPYTVTGIKVGGAILKRKCGSLEHNGTYSAESCGECVVFIGPHNVVFC